MFNKCDKSAANGHNGDDKLLWGYCGCYWPLLVGLEKTLEGSKYCLSGKFEAKAHDLVTSNGRYVVVGGCWVPLALVGRSLLKPPQPTSATTRLLGEGLLHPGHGRPPISSSGWTSWITTCRWTTSLGVGHRSLHSGSCPSAM